MTIKEENIETIIGKEFSPKVIPYIQEAEKSIKIIAFDWRNYKTDIGSGVFFLNQALFMASRRGVDIRVIVAAKNINAKWLKSFFKVKELYSKKIIHSKMMLIDDKILILGSHNYTFSGLELNQELSIIIKGENDIKRFVNFFDKLYG